MLWEVLQDLIVFAVGLFCTFGGMSLVSKGIQDKNLCRFDKGLFIIFGGFSTLVGILIIYFCFLWVSV